MSTAERQKPTILFATIAAGGGHVAGAHAMAESVERLKEWASESSEINQLIHFIQQCTRGIIS